MTLASSIPLIVLVVLILAFGIYVLFHKKKRFSDRDLASFRKLWKDIESQVKEHPDQAVLKADKLLDHILIKAGYSGTFGEKLKKARPIFRDNNALWSAHKLRNRIAHEIHVTVSEKQAQYALKAFKSSLIDLGVSL